MKSLLLFITFVLVVVPLPVINGQTKLSAQQTDDSNKQLTEIEQYVSGRRKAIDNYYTDRILDLRLNARAEIRLLELAEQPKPDFIFLDEWADFVEKIAQINYLENGSRKLLRTKTYSPAERLAVVLNKIARRKNDLISQMEWDAVMLERQKKYAANGGLEYFQEKLKKNLTQAKPQTTHGVIAGIIYSADDPISIIDGTIVRQNENIHGVKIVKILEDRVEFEKNGGTWTQKIRETQKDKWQ